MPDTLQSIFLLVGFTQFCFIQITTIPISMICIKQLYSPQNAINASKDRSSSNTIEK